MNRRFGRNVTLYDRIYLELVKSVESELTKFRKLNVSRFELSDLYAGFLNDNIYFVGIRVDESKKEDVDKALKTIGKYFNLKTSGEKGRQGTYIGKIYVPSGLLEENFLETEKRMGRVCNAHKQ